MIYSLIPKMAGISSSLDRALDIVEKIKDGEMSSLKDGDYKHLLDVLMLVHKLETINVKPEVLAWNDPLMLPHLPPVPNNPDLPQTHTFMLGQTRFFVFCAFNTSVPRILRDRSKESNIIYHARQSGGTDVIINPKTGRLINVKCKTYIDFRNDNNIDDTLFLRILSHPDRIRDYIPDATHVADVLTFDITNGQPGTPH